VGVERSVVGGVGGSRGFESDNSAGWRRAEGGVTWIDGCNEGESDVGGVEGLQTPEGALEEMEDMVIESVNKKV
jgi:hypothetical protein